MCKRTRRIAAGLALTAGALLTGCGGSSGVKSNAQTRGVNVATNVVYPPTATDEALVLINGGSSDISVPYGTPSHYLYVVSGISSFQAGVTSLGLPSIATAPVPPSTTWTVPNVPLPITYTNLAGGGHYTGYLIGRPDVPVITQQEVQQGETSANLDPRILTVVVTTDNQAAPPPGQAVVRVLNGACDAGFYLTPKVTLDGVDVYLNGAATPTFKNVPYAALGTTTSANVTLPAGTVSISVNATGTTYQLVTPTKVSLASGGRYTLVVNEPTATYTQLLNGVPVIPPFPSLEPSAYTWGVVLVQN